MIQDQIGIPACFTGEKPTDDTTAVTKSGQSVFMSVYRTKLADQSRLITITWCKNLVLHSLSISVEGTEGGSHYCKVELKPWYFWRKQGCKSFTVDGRCVDVFWDFRAAKFNGETEPTSEYYVAVVCDEEVVLLLGDLKKNAYRKTRCRPSLIDPILVSKREHVFGKKKFFSKVKFDEKGKLHEISIDFKTSCLGCEVDLEMEIRIDGNLVVHVKHLQWKFRGNESIQVNKLRVEVCWDVHDWLFSAGLRHALFIFKPTFSSSSASIPSSLPESSSASTPLSCQTRSSGSVEGFNTAGSSEFCLFLYAWKVE
ncbi:hypothetical protein NMG60_11002929 [Bertholletia excelsa]